MLPFIVKKKEGGEMERKNFMYINTYNCRCCPAPSKKNKKTAENTFYLYIEAVCLYIEHILSIQNTFYLQRTHSVYRKNPIHRKYIVHKKVLSIYREHILSAENIPKSVHKQLAVENTFYLKRTHLYIENTF
jgi:hypothetical protein